MKKYIIISATLILGLVVVVSGSKGQGKDKDKKKDGKILTVNITDKDTIINGKKFKELSKAEKEEFRKMEKEMKSKKVIMDRRMKDLDKEMQTLNKRVLVFDDEDISTIDLDGDDSKIVIRKSVAPRAPRAPRAPHHPEGIDVVPPSPDFPSMEEFEMNISPNAFKFHMNSDRDEDAQVFTFNDGGNRTVVKMMQANSEDLKKIGASKNEEFKMFPNPAKDYITINLASDIAVNYLISDILGRKLATGNTAQQKTIDISTLAPGMYLLSFSDNDNNSHTLKFIKQ